MTNTQSRILIGTHLASSSSCHVRFHRHRVGEGPIQHPGIKVTSLIMESKYRTIHCILSNILFKGSSGSDGALIYGKFEVIDYFCNAASFIIWKLAIRMRMPNSNFS